jgi:hypothetical protein
MLNRQTRSAMVAGQFYPADPRALADAVDGFMSEASVDPAPEGVRALVAPHAGYVYSGLTAAHAYGRAKGKKPSRVILLGCSHRYPISRASVYLGNAFESPLGAFPVDKEFASALAEKTASDSVEPHFPEHALEVQLPFLHAAFGGMTPIVPVLFGGHSSWHAELGKELAEMAGADDLVIASTDLSHYLSQDEANAIDQRTVDAILSRDFDEVGRGIDERRYSMCGAAAVICTMAFAGALGADDWRLLDYRTSAETSGDFERVVGYAAISMEKA